VYFIQSQAKQSKIPGRKQQQQQQNKKETFVRDSSAGENGPLTFVATLLPASALPLREVGREGEAVELLTSLRSHILLPQVYDGNDQSGDDDAHADDERENPLGSHCLWAHTGFWTWRSRPTGSHQAGVSGSGSGLLRSVTEGKKVRLRVRRGYGDYDPV